MRGVEHVTVGHAERLRSGARARIGRVDLQRLAWLTTVFACLVAVAILATQGYLGYAGVTLAVAVAAAVNLL
jgi:hypothetical protein